MRCIGAIRLGAATLLFTACGGATHSSEPAGGGGQLPGATGGSAGSAAAAGGSAGSAPVDCGGDLLGAWEGVDEHVPLKARPAGINECWNLQTARMGDGTFFASSHYPLPEIREVAFTFTPDSYVFEDVRRGPVTLSYSQACLAASGGSPTCTELAAALTIDGLNQGSFQKADCVTDNAGGCVCSINMAVVGGGGGTWSSQGNTLTVVEQAGTPYQKKVTTPYCVQAGRLRFGTAFDGFSDGLSRITYAPPDCSDRQASLLESGIDCGPVCPQKTCP